jgi:hypothetical protein
MLILKFGLYVNWGRPNHNPSRLKPLIDSLTEEGYGIQLEHDPDVSDFVELQLAADKTVLSREDTFQHNANFDKRPAMSATLIEKMKIKLAA